MQSVYRIKVRGTLDPKWSDWFDGFEINALAGKTVLTGQVVDQAALHGILDKLHDLRLTLLSVELMKNEKESST